MTPGLMSPTGGRLDGRRRLLTVTTARQDGDHTNSNDRSTMAKD